MVDVGHERVFSQLQALGAGEESSSAGADSPGSDQKSRGMARYLRTEQCPRWNGVWIKKCRRVEATSVLQGRRETLSYVALSIQTVVAEPQLSDAARQSKFITIKLFNSSHPNSYTMPRATAGTLVQCDPSIKAIISKINEENGELPLTALKALKDTVREAEDSGSE
ncbi:hypothetical protein KCU65_g172, partial [Aureobasidium melanogenum]